jgi:hypothetical protein
MGAGSSVVDPGPLDLLNVGWVLQDGPPVEHGLIEVARSGGEFLYRRPTARPYAFAGEHAVPVNRHPNTVRVRCSLPRAETLVVSESWMPGWRASLDGRPAPVLPYRGALLSVEIPAGEHEVLFAYEPTPYRVGRWISGIALLGTLVTLLILRLRRRCQALARPSAAC